MAAEVARCAPFGRLRVLRPTEVLLCIVARSAWKSPVPYGDRARCVQAPHGFKGISYEARGAAHHRARSRSALTDRQISPSSFPLRTSRATTPAFNRSPGVPDASTGRRAARIHGAGVGFLDRRQTLRRCRFQRTAKGKGKETSLSLPLLTYSAPGGLRQGPGGAAESSAETTTCGNGGPTCVCCRRVGDAVTSNQWWDRQRGRECSGWRCGGARRPTGRSGRPTRRREGSRRRGRA